MNAQPKQAVKPRPIDAVEAKYTACGWKTMRVNGVNDLIAQRGKKLHFVQVVIDDSDARHRDLARHMFIQNAFSNDALPIHARVNAARVSFEDANTNARVVVSARAKQPAPDPRPPKQN